MGIELLRKSTTTKHGGRQNHRLQHEQKCPVPNFILRPLIREASEARFRVAFTSTQQTFASAASANTPKVGHVFVGILFAVSVSFERMFTARIHLMKATDDTPRCIDIASVNCRDYASCGNGLAQQRKSHGSGTANGPVGPTAAQRRSYREHSHQQFTVLALPAMQQESRPPNGISRKSPCR